MSSTEKVIITYKEGATDADKQAVEDSIRQQGGQVHDRLDLINGFTATLPKSFTSSLQGHEHIDSIEPDGVVTTQNSL
ncbi:hypothetical protein GQ54DRAFT_309810 [Martensiomyces pterosporus]|nr:hypothetical protein GQ54DRAFT_309810 [Martensiomyces pterosporus]